MTMRSLVEFPLDSQPKGRSTACVATLALLLACSCSSGDATGDHPEHKVVSEAQESETKFRGEVIDQLGGYTKNLQDIESGNLKELTSLTVESHCISAHKQQVLADKKEALDKATSALEAATSAEKVFHDKFRYHEHNTSKRRKVWCGGDGCEGSCAPACAAEDVCHANQCRCIPNCQGKQCGKDGCGGFCGEFRGRCDADSVCTKQSTCEGKKMLSKACVPSCKGNGAPSRPAERVWDKKQGDVNLRLGSRYQSVTFEELEGLKSYISTLRSHAKTLQERVSGHQALAAQIVTMKTDFDASVTAVEAARTERVAKQAALQAATLQPETTPEAKAEAVATAQQAVAGAVAQEQEAAKVSKEKRVVHDKAVAQYKKNSKEMDRLQTAYARIDAERKRAQAFANKWQAATDAVVKALALSDKARTELQAAAANLAEKTLKSRIDSLKKRRSVASKGLLSTKQKKSLECSGIRCPVSKELWALDEDYLPLSSTVEVLQSKASQLDTAMEMTDGKELIEGLKAAVGEDFTPVEEAESNDDEEKSAGKDESGGQDGAAAAKLLVMLTSTEESSDKARLNAVLAHVAVLHPGCKNAVTDELVEKRTSAALPYVAVLFHSMIGEHRQTVKDALVLLKALDAANERLLGLRKAGTAARERLAH